MPCPEPLPAAPIAAKTAPAAQQAPESKPRLESPTLNPPHAPQLPAILFEGDELSGQPGLASGNLPGESPNRVQLPDAYGSGKLSLLPRDPHSIYAYWDFTQEQLEHYNTLSADKHMMLLVWQTGQTHRLVIEISLHPDSRHWFVHVPIAGAGYYAELGYYDADRRWTTVSVSEPINTPGGTSQSHAAAAAVFASISVEPESPASPHRPRAEETPGEKWTASRHPVPPAPMPEAEAWDALIPPEPMFAGIAGTPAAIEPTQSLQAESREQALAPWTTEAAREILRIAETTTESKHVAGSIEVVDLLKRWIREGVGISSMEAMEFGLAQEQAPISSPGMPEGLAAPEVQGPPPAFWLDVNAELVIYGATEPGANVTIGGRVIRLRPDGSFSYRFALPDGQYELPVRAVSAAGDARGATLRFARETSCEGEVAAHPQEPDLLPPSPDNIPQ